jgi:hypothetical protein
MSSSKRPIEGAEPQGAPERRRQRFCRFDLCSDSDTDALAKEGKKTLYGGLPPIGPGGLDALVQNEVRVGVKGWSKGRRG